MCIWGWCRVLIWAGVPTEPSVVAIALPYVLDDLKYKPKSKA